MKSEVRFPMKPVYQTLLGKPRGNCRDACICTILGIQLDDFPPGWVGDGTGWREPEDCNWIDRLNEVLARWGVRWVQTPAESMSWSTPGTLAILSGLSPRETPEAPMSHAVVGRYTRGGDWEIVHDPHPDGGGLKEIRYVSFLVVQPTAGPEGR